MEFLTHLIVEGPTTRKRGQHVSAIINHHAWENPKFSKEMIGMITAVIEENVYDEVRPVFRVLAGLLTIQDSLWKDRLDWMLSTWLAVMKQQDKFWKITDLCVEHLIRIAKKNNNVFQWLSAHPDRWVWLIDWITQFPNQPSQMDNNIALYKPNKHPQSWSRGYSLGLSSKKKRLALEAIREGKELDKGDSSDSDEDLSERVFTVGQLIDCKDTANKWLLSKVVDMKEGYVFVHYESWSSKWDEWIETSDSRIAKLHRWTQPPSTAIVLEPTAGRGGGDGAEGSSSTALVLASSVSTDDP